VFVNECSPGGGALDSNPHAMIASIEPCCDLVVTLAAAQVFNSIKTSDLASAKRVCMADQ
jgi:hypothetical protein